FFFVFFFFQAEDGIRDRNVTGVQTCALPIFIATGSFICKSCLVISLPAIKSIDFSGFFSKLILTDFSSSPIIILELINESCSIFTSLNSEPNSVLILRSEERRVGKECRSRSSRLH